MASAVPNRERNGALAPGNGKTCSQCSSGQHPEFSAYVLRHHQDQPRPRPVAVGTECQVDDRRASLLRSGQEIPASRLCRNARPSAFIGDGMTVERAMQLVKGGFSYRLKKECGHWGEVWQGGFSETRVECRQSFIKHREYIAANPVKAGLVERPEEFPYCFTYLARRKAAGAKALN